MVFLGSKAAPWDVLSAWHLAEIRQEGVGNIYIYIFFFSSQQNAVTGTVLRYSSVDDDWCVSSNTPFQDGWEQEWNNWVLVDLSKCLPWLCAVCLLLLLFTCRT